MIILMEALYLRKYVTLEKTYGFAPFKLSLLTLVSVNLIKNPH